MRYVRVGLVATLVLLAPAPAAILLAPRPAAAQGDFPPRGQWAHVQPAAAGFDPARLREAVAYAESSRDTSRTDSASLAHVRPRTTPSSGPGSTRADPRGA